MDNKYRITAYVDKDTLDRVKMLAEGEGISMSRIAEESVRIGLPRREEISERRRADLGIE